MIPNKIKIKSDGNVLQYVGLSKDKKLHVYKYVKSITKLNQELPMSEEQINKLILGTATIEN